MLQIISQTSKKMATLPTLSSPNRKLRENIQNLKKVRDLIWTKLSQNRTKSLNTQRKTNCYKGNISKFALDT
jgi:hypothetical protein